MQINLVPALCRMHKDVTIYKVFARMRERAGIRVAEAGIEKGNIKGDAVGRNERSLPAQV